MKIIQNIGNKQSREVTAGDMQKIRALIPEMHQLCLEPLGNHKDGAFALAHCQVDQEDPLRFFVLNDGSCVINPKIIDRIGEPFRNEEGCMSFSECAALLGVQRYKKVRVSFIGLADADSEAEEQDDFLAEDLIALVFQHEVDHMNGKHIYSK